MIQHDSSTHQSPCKMVRNFAAGMCLVGITTVFNSCLLENKTSSDPVFTCDASESFAEMCIEEPIDFATQQASKSTCLSARGNWSDTKFCPSGYTKQCSDGNKTNYYYGKTDAKKSCAELVLLNPQSQMSHQSLFAGMTFAQ